MKLIGKKIETPDRDYFSFVFLVLTVSLLEKTRVIKDLTGDIERRRQKSTLIGIEETVAKKEERESKARLRNYVRCSRLTSASNWNNLYRQFLSRLLLVFAVDSWAAEILVSFIFLFYVFDP